MGPPRATPSGKFRPIYQEWLAKYGFPDSPELRAKFDAAKCPHDTYLLEVEEANKRDRAKQMIEMRRELDAMWVEMVGARYKDCTFDSFKVDNDAQQKVVDACRQYAAAVRDEPQQSNLVLTGPCGTGKDHLALAICHSLAFPENVNDSWPAATEKFFWGPWSNCKCVGLVSGDQLATESRDAMHDGKGAELVKRYTRPDLLVLSDPATATGHSLTSFQASSLTQVVDGRYRNMKPLIVTINVENREQFEKLLTVPMVDRMLHDAIVLECDWPSYRRTRKGTT